MPSLCMCDSNGDLDPWSAGGVLQSPSASLVSIVIKDAAHHLDLRGSNPDDTAAVIAARKKEKAIVKSWIQRYWSRPRSTTTQVLLLECPVIIAFGYVLLVHGQVTIIFVVSVCLFVCLFAQSFSQPSLIRFPSNLDICYMSGSSCVP